MRRLPSLTGLKSFEAAARLGSFTLAAAELSVTQAAISRSVKALEGQLGYALFDRSANRLALTLAGRSLLPDASAAFDALEKAIGRIDLIGRSSVLTIGVGPTFAIRWLIPRLARFHALYPDIEVHTTTAGPTASLRPDWTCSLRLGKDPGIGVQSVPLFSALMTPVCSPAVAARLRRMADLYTVPLLDVTPTSDDWTLWLEAAALRADRVNRRQVFPTHAFALQAALDGLGVAMGLHPYVVDDLKVGRLVAPFALQVERPVGWHLVYRREALSNPAFKLFRSWVNKEAKVRLPPLR